MHIIEMKKHGFIKNKVVEHIVKTNVEKATLILHTNVTHGINDLNKFEQIWPCMDGTKPTTSEYDI
jgi:imidazoleglycerol phosphate dehydratase HisB